MRAAAAAAPPSVRVYANCIVADGVANRALKCWPNFAPKLLPFEAQPRAALVRSSDFLSSSLTVWSLHKKVAPKRNASEECESTEERKTHASERASDSRLLRASNDATDCNTFKAQNVGGNKLAADILTCALCASCAICRLRRPIDVKFRAHITSATLLLCADARKCQPQRRDARRRPTCCVPQEWLSAARIQLGTHLLAAKCIAS